MVGTIVLFGFLA